MKQITLLFILIFLLTSCQQKRSEKAVYSIATSENQMAPSPDLMRNSPLPVETTKKSEAVKKKIIKDGRLGIRVKNLEKTKSRIDTLVNYYGGYYDYDKLNNTDYESSYNLKIRIPAPGFEAFIKWIESGEGEILYKEINARDVTDEFIDLETRLENKRHYLSRYNDLLKKANSVKEILEIEEKIRSLEEEIESTTGRLNYMADLVDYSTLDLTISKQKEFKFIAVDHDRFSERLKQSLSKGWFGLINFLLFFIKIWPIWIIGLMFLYFWNRYKRKKKKN
jgi:hypothetical protein